MKASPPRLHTSHLTADERALQRCEAALRLKDRGEYFKAQEVMRPFWKGLGTRPDIAGLHQGVVAEVLLCAGILTRWIGSRNQTREAQNVAKDLISESLTIFESLGDVLKVAAARSELAYCYWREGAFGEARIWFDEALQKLTTEGNTRANALLGLAVVEWADSRYAESLRILTANASLFKRISNHTIKGAYHTQVAMVLSNLITAENKTDYIQRAINEFHEADSHFKLARNIGYRADVINNVAFLLYKLSRFDEAHRYLTEARRLASSAKDRIRVAQMDDTQALVFLAEGKAIEAEAAARRAVSVLERTDHFCLLADMLITHGMTLARLPDTERAEATLQRAIEISLKMDAFIKAGLAALTLVEELIETLDQDAIMLSYNHANHWLSALPNEEVQLRLNVAARKVLARKPSASENAAERFIKRSNLRKDVLNFEGVLIRRALLATEGRVTRAAALLGTSRQALVYVINARHPELLKLRSPVRPRQPKKKDV